MPFKCPGTWFKAPEYVFTLHFRFLENSKLRYLEVEGHWERVRQLVAPVADQSSFSPIPSSALLQTPYYDTQLVCSQNSHFNGFGVSSDVTFEARRRGLCRAKRGVPDENHVKIT